MQISIVVVADAHGVREGLGVSHIAADAGAGVAFQKNSSGRVHLVLLVEEEVVQADGSSAIADVGQSGQT